MSCGLLLCGLSGLALVPALHGQSMLLAGGGLIVSILLLAALRRLPSAPPAPAPAPVPPPAPVPVAQQAEAEVLALLGALQAKGRFIDFLMDDVSRYTDAQVGAAARVVQQGCKAALAENLEIVPVSLEKEGTTIAVPTDGAADDYRLVGHVAGEPPYRGKLVHKGWKAARITLPRVLQAAADRRPPIAPAQVELS